MLTYSNFEKIKAYLNIYNRNLWSQFPIAASTTHIFYLLSIDRNDPRVLFLKKLLINESFNVKVLP